MKGLVNRDAEGIEETIEHRFELLAPLLRRERRAEKCIELLFCCVDLGSSLLFRAFFVFDDGKPGLPFFFARLVHACKRVLLVDDVANAGDEALRLHLVVGPTGIVIREVDDTSQHFTAFT